MRRQKQRYMEQRKREAQAWNRNSTLGGEKRRRENRKGTQGTRESPRETGEPLEPANRTAGGFRLDKGVQRGYTVKQQVPASRGDARSREPTEQSKNHARARNYDSEGDDRSPVSPPPNCSACKCPSFGPTTPQTPSVIILSYPSPPVRLAS